MQQTIKSSPYGELFYSLVGANIVRPPINRTEIFLPRRGGNLPPQTQVDFRTIGNAPLYPTAQLRAANSRPYWMGAANHRTKHIRPL